MTDDNWREASWSAGLGSSSQEICQSRIRDYVYNGLGRDEGIRPCKFIGLPKFCRLSDRSITAYEIYGYHTVFLDVTGKDNVERVQSHVVWLADPVPESLP